jgi:hypothetical protein
MKNDYDYLLFLLLLIFVKQTHSGSGRGLSGENIFDSEQASALSPHQIDLYQV